MTLQEAEANRLSGKIKNETDEIRILIASCETMTDRDLQQYTLCDIWKLADCQQ